MPDTTKLQQLRNPNRRVPSPERNLRQHLRGFAADVRPNDTIHLTAFRRQIRADFAERAAPPELYRPAKRLQSAHQLRPRPVQVGQLVELRSEERQFQLLRGQGWGGRGVPGKPEYDRGRLPDLVLVDRGRLGPERIGGLANSPEGRARVVARRGLQLLR